MDPLFVDINADQPISEIESVCMECHEMGITRLLLTRIPFYKEIVIMAFECSHCGFKNSEIQSALGLADKGCTITCNVINKQDLNRQIVKTESCSIRIAEIDFEIPAATQKGLLNTIEGFLAKAAEDLAQLQPLRKEQQPQVYAAVSRVIEDLQLYLEGDKPFTLVLDDPAGNSFIENLCAPKEDPQLEIRYYLRTKEQLESLGYATEPVENYSQTESNSEKPKDKTIVDDNDDNEDDDNQDDDTDIPEVMEFPSPCSYCRSPSVTKMHVLNIPYFKEVVVMSTCCDSCGYKNNEIKAGGPISAKGKRTILKVTAKEDLSRDILKSETCGLSLPEIELELMPGTLGGRFTTIEGILDQVRDELLEKNPFAGGDSAEISRKQAVKNIVDKISMILQDDPPNFTLVLDDPLANSYLQNLYAPDPDPNMTVEEYERSFEQNEDLGINDMKV